MTVISTSLCRKPRSCTICSRKLQPSCHRKRRLEITALQQMREAPAPLAKWVQVRSSCGSQATSNTKLHYTWPKLQYHERKFIIALTIKKNTYANFLIHKAWTQIPRPNSKNFASYTHWCKHPIPQHLLVVSQSSTPPANGESPPKVNDHRFLNWQRRRSVVLNWELRYQNKNRSKQFIEHAEAKTIIPTGKRKATSKLSLSFWAQPKMREASNLFSMSHLQTHSWRFFKYVGKSSLRQRWARHLENHSHAQKVWPEETVLARLELADSVSKARSTWATPRHGNNMEALGQHAGILPMSSDRSNCPELAHDNHDSSVWRLCCTQKLWLGEFLLAQ